MGNQITIIPNHDIHKSTREHASTPHTPPFHQGSSDAQHPDAASAPEHRRLDAQLAADRVAAQALHFIGAVKHLQLALLAELAQGAGQGLGADVELDLLRCLGAPSQPRAQRQVGQQSQVEVG